MGSEARRLGEIKQNWVEIEKLPPVVIRSLIAAEDANFCKHFGFDIEFNNNFELSSILHPPIPTC